MKILVTMKSLAKRKNFLTKEERSFSNVPATIRELVTELVKIEFQQYQSKEPDIPIVAFLSNVEIQEGAAVGKVGFKTRYNESISTVESAIQTAIQAFDDGLFKLFLNEEEQYDLDAPIELQDSDELTLIKLTMLAGRMW